MRKGLLLLVFLCQVFVGTAIAADTKHLLEQQTQFSSQLSKIQTSSGEQVLFLEDILRRKNIVLRENISNLITKSPNAEELKILVPAQAEMLQALIAHGDKQVRDLFIGTRDASSAEKAELQFLTQQRISSIDLYYSELATTFSWAKKIGIELNEAGFKADLTKRGEDLFDIVIYMDSRKKALDERMSYTVEADKADLEKQIFALQQLQRFLLSSMNTTVSLMSNFGLDVTEYKQTLFSMTGDINADVLDVNVAFGLLREWVDSFKDWAFDNSPSLLIKLLVFIAILWITRILARIISNLIKKSVSHSKMDFSILMQDFFISIAAKAVTFIGLLIALSQVGINLGPLLTGFGVAGVIIGFALQDTLSNFASGLMILIYRPFDVKDLVQVAGIQGTVSHMSLVSTTVRTLDNQTLVIPNNKIWGDVINNMTSERVRRVDMVFGIAYSDDFDFAKKIAIQVLENHDRVLKNPELNVRVHTLNESSVDLIVRPWVRTDDYWDVYWDVTEEMKRQFDANGITIPFPQRDVHVFKTDS